MAPIGRSKKRCPGWGNTGDQVRDALHGHPGLTLQPTDFRFRVSYDLEPDGFDPLRAATSSRRWGMMDLISDNRFFDVLPMASARARRCSRLVDHLGDQARLRVLSAGDTLNDLSMLECGIPAVAVGGSEAALIERVARWARLHWRKRHGAAGIVEAILALDLHTDPEGY